MLGKTTEYAIRALVFIYIRNNEGRRPGFKEIAKQIDSPEQFTAKVLQNLTRAGLLSSIRGRGGGFFFKDPKTPLTLFEIIRSIEGERYFFKCGFGLNQCDASNPCPMHKDYSQVRESFSRYASNQTIESLANNISEQKAILTRI